MGSEFQVVGKNAKAPFTLKLHRGDGMTLLAMNWKKGKPPQDFVGFAIEYREPGGDRFFPLKNRLAFAAAGGDVNPNRLTTRLSPIQKFRWVHFPRNAELAGDFTYRVTPVFMNATDELSYGEAQEAKIRLMRETYPNKLNVTFTRGFVSSQAFVDKFGSIAKLIPPSADQGLTFKPTHPRRKEALAWMGFEARSAIYEVLDRAIADKQARVRVVAYDLGEQKHAVTADPSVGLARVDRHGPLPAGPQRRDLHLLRQFLQHVRARHGRAVHRGGCRDHRLVDDRPGDQPGGVRREWPHPGSRAWSPGAAGSGPRRSRAQPSPLQPIACAAANRGLAQRRARRLPRPPTARGTGLARRLFYI